MRLLVRLSLKLLSSKFTALPWLGLIAGLCLCGFLISSEKLAPFQQLHLWIYGVPVEGVVYEKTIDADGKYYVSCSFLLRKGDGSIESVLRTRETSDFLYQLLRKGDRVEVVYSARISELWMFRDQVNELISTGIMTCLGLILLICSGGMIFALRPKE